MTTLLHPATYADVNDVAEVMAHAFRNDPPMSAVLGPSDDLPARAHHLFSYFMHAGPLQHGTVDVVRDVDSGKILGAAIWHAPHSGHSTFQDILNAQHIVKAFGIRGIRRALAASRATQRHHPTAPHWYLQAIGVTPQARGRGIASQLIKHRLGQADAAGMPAYLESSTEATSVLYRRHGFIELPPMRGYPGPAPRPMWRPVHEKPTA